MAFLGLTVVGFVFLHLAGAARVQPSSYVGRLATQTLESQGVRASTQEALPHLHRTANMEGAASQSDSSGSVEQQNPPDVPAQTAISKRSASQAFSFLQAEFNQIGAIFGIGPPKKQSSRERPLQAILHQPEKRSNTAPTRVAVLALVILSCIGGAALCSGRPKKRKCPPGRNQYIVNDQIVYEWDQTPVTITIYTKPPGTANVDNISVVISPQHLVIGRKGSKTHFLKEEIFAQVDVEASNWGISQKGELEVCLVKAEEGKWPCVVSAHEGATKLASLPRSASSASEFEVNEHQ